MTTFNSLPNETLQRIVDCCHEADETYRQRKWKTETKPQRKKTLAKMGKTNGTRVVLYYDEWWGRSCSAVSMVNKNLRSMAIKHVFTTLYESRAKSDLFQYAILGALPGDCITTVVFDTSEFRHGDSSLFTFICRTLPLLPNLSTAKCLQWSTFHQLGLTSPSKTIDPTQLAMSRRAKEVLVQLASQITTWDLTLDAELTELLVSQNYDRIKSITLQTPYRHHNSAILESDDSNFPSILSKCSNLRHLTIAQSHLQSTQTVNPIADFVLSIPFSFVSTLRSLDLDLERYGGSTSPNELTFASLFPSLESLRIRFRSENIEDLENESFLLPKLTSLEVIDCPFSQLHILLQSLALPSITSISVSQAEVSAHEMTNEDQIDEMGVFASEIEALPTSLQLLHFAYSGICQEATSLLSSLQGYATVEVDTELVSVKNDSANVRGGGRRRRRFSSDSEGEESDEDETEDVSSSGSSQRREEGLNDGIESTKELLDWARGRIEGCQGVDNVGVEELTRVLEPVKELREWLED